MANRDEVRSQFGPSAADYATSDVHAAGESLGLLLELVRPKSDWSVLDVATGAGHTALTFAPRVANVIAGDITQEMLSQTAQLARQRGIENLRTQQADAEALPFGDGTFDLVTCRLAFHHFPNPLQALKEFARVLKPGGVLGFTDNITVEEPAAADYYNRYEKLRDPSHHCVLPLSELVVLLSQAGLLIDAVHRLTKEFEFHLWADRQRVSDENKAVLQQMMDNIPGALVPLFEPRKADGTLYFSLWEAVVVAHLPAQ